MIVKEVNWDRPDLKDLKELIVAEWDKIAERVFSDCTRSLSTKTAVMPSFEDFVNENCSMYLESYINPRDGYIVSIEFLKTGGTLVSLLFKWDGMCDPSRLDLIY